MKKLFRNVLCAAALALTLGTNAIAAEPGDLSIQFNGQPLTFTDAVPQIISDRTYLPFRAVFTALGFEDENITYANDTQTVAAVRDDLEVSMVIGENQVTIVEEGQKRVLGTDVPAFIDPAVSRTYIPVSFVAQAVGYRVAWDGDTRTVFIDDVDGILAANTETYKILDKYLEYNQQFLKKNHSVKGKFSYRIDVLGEALEMNGTYSALTAGNTLFDSEVEMNLFGTSNGMKLESVTPDGITMDVRGNMSTGEVYYKADTLEATTESEQENIWYRSRENGFHTGTGMTYVDMIGLPSGMVENMDGKAFIEARVRSAIETDTAASAVDYLAIYNAMLGDRFFAKDRSDYVNAVRIGEVGMSVRFHTAANKVTGYTVTMESKGEGMTMTTEVSMKKDRMTALYEIGDATTSTRMELDGAYTATQKEPVGAPDKGAVVLEMPEAKK